ncbi:MAG: Fic family protein [Candidatus Thermoplasmatota archaeon]|jgi:Fic family protein|nr:Fic family protein [Candidatus Thermoplasmatota archaeon]MCL6002236.1 Fic family protein [Candidatus Thermoplasmatota archaeon]
MVTIRKEERNGNTYYYLEHSFRIKGRTIKREKYLGKHVPKDIDRIKSLFLHDIYAERWYSQFELIRKEFTRQQKAMPAEGLKKYLESFMIKFTYDTQKIEGSTLNFRDTRNILVHGITPPNRSISDVKEVEQHRKVFYEMLETKKDISLPLIMEWHYELFKDTETEIAGKVRKHQVAISGSKFEPPSPVEVDSLLYEFIRWYNRSKLKTNPVELACLVHLRFVTIHPFTDGNGRMSRLLMNFVLQRSGYPMLNIEYRNRSSYYTALERSQVKTNDGPFVQWFFRRYLETNKSYLRVSK